jgi:hypothetical protein
LQKKITPKDEFNEREFTRKRTKQFLISGIKRITKPLRTVISIIGEDTLGSNRKGVWKVLCRFRTTIQANKIDGILASIKTDAQSRR